MSMAMARSSQHTTSRKAGAQPVFHDLNQYTEDEVRELISALHAKCLELGLSHNQAEHAANALSRSARMGMQKK